MVYSEFKKIFGNKFFWLIICIALSVNLLILSGYEPENIRRSQLTYSEYIHQIIETAQYKLDEYKIMGYSENAFVCEYQQKVIDTYGHLNSLSVDMYSSSNWQLLFSYNGSAVLIVICAFLCGFIIFYSDRFNGTIYIIRTTRNGRIFTGIGKVIVAIICSVMITLLFELSEIVYTGVFQNSGNITEPLQTVPGMEMCPYSLSIIEGLTVRYLIHLLCFAVVLFLSCLLTSLFNSYITIFLYGIAVTGSQYMVTTIPFLNQYSFLNVVNIFKIFKLDFIKRFTAIQITGYCIIAEDAIVNSILLLIITLIIGSVICFGKRRYKQSNINFWKILKQKRERYYIITNKFFRINHVSIFKNEVYKLFVKPVALLVIIMYVFLQLYISSDSFSPDLSYSDNRYKEYMELLEGEPTDEKAEYIYQQLSYMDEIIGNEQLIRQKYAKGEITATEYNDYQIEYYKCLDELPILQRVNEQYNRCVSLRAAGYHTILIYDTGWILYLTRSADYLLIIILVLLLAGIVSYESESGILPIIRTTVNGRINLLYKKYLVAVFGCIIGWFISEVIPAFYCYANYYLPKGSISIYSVNYNLGDIDITINQYVILTLLVHLLGILILGMFTTSLSLLIKRTYIVILTGVVLYLVRPILSYFSIELISTPDIFLSAGSFHILTYLIWGVATIALSMISIYKYCNGRMT